MSNEATSLVSYEHSECEYVYRMAHTVQTIVSAMQDSITTRMQQMALVSVTLQFVSEGNVGKIPLSHSVVAQSTHYYLDVLRRLVRKTDEVYLLDSTLYFLLLGANSEGGSIVQDRLWDALLWRVHNTHEYGILRPRFMAIGHAAFPIPQDNAYACVIAADRPCYSFDMQPERATCSVGYQHEIKEEEIVTPDAETVFREGELMTLARKLGVPYLSLLPRKKTEQVQRLVTLELVHELQCYPLGREHGTLTVALSNPHDSSILHRLQQETGLRIFPVLTHPHELQIAISQLF